MPQPFSSRAPDSPGVIREALARVLLANAPAEQPRLLHDASRALSQEARRDGMRPEQLIVAVKQAWAELPEARARRLTPAHGMLLDRLISLCITQYYDGDGNPAQTRAETGERPSA